MNNQLDLFGNVPKIKPLNVKTKKGKFRQAYGYKYGYKCKDCVFFMNGGKFKKCSKLGDTNGSATDIRLKDIACKLYKEKGK